MGIPRDSTPYGSQTLVGPGWPNVEEELLAEAAEQFEQLAMHLTAVVIPQQQGQMTKLGADWTGAGSLAAQGEASTIISGHEINAAQASAIALALRTMEASVVKTKTLVNATAQQIQHMCEAIEAMPVQNKEELLQSAIKLGQSQNMADVMEGTSELAGNLGVPAVNPAAIPIPPGGVPGVGQVGEAAEKAGQAGGQAGGQGGQQGMQMMGQMMSQMGQVPQQLGKMTGGMGLQQMTQPLQQISSMFGQLGRGGAGGAGAGVSPFPAFSNHPAAGGSGARAGAGLGHGASVPGAGGSSPRTPLMAKLVDKHTTVAPTAVEEGAVAGTTATAGAAPVAGGGVVGGMGPMGMMGQRGVSGGSRAGLPVPTPLDHDLSEDEGDDDW
ncbi:hypothetical protein [Mycobacterium shimoidei]|uniref:hypothetical protein n=1 Tax=Mycobacterium shimoidei TaxID=29313 RepID=UPI0008487F1C|nr:hypothetical protein [Mycobacterium shimoidei]MCV7260230.1 hypothetical protein [Mycobacterium shimoidei]ODR12880.1 hypothetical protein BHQ16_13410 [Mycobacterium shimoidei]ORW80766.1 hypothetical protein AWC26_10700 [Mycobacterium shimoidei]